MNTSQNARLATFPARTDANARRTVSEAVSDAIASLRRSGGADCPECEAVSVSTLAYLFRLTNRQAWAAWLQHAATVTPA
jgi:hypothetical protein